MRNSVIRVLMCVAFLSLVPIALASTFNRQADNEAWVNGYFYAISAGQFVNGQTANGLTGAVYYLYDDPADWGSQPDVWHQDGWFAEDSGLAVTLQDKGVTVYDNNGIEGGDTANFYHQYPAGYIVGYSMANNFDFIYAGLVTLSAPTEISDIITYFSTNGYPGYFDPNAGWDYRTNIWSSVNGAPVNTGSFTGNVFTSDYFPGYYTWSDTGVSRPVSSADPDTTDPRHIYRLDYHLAHPITLAAGEYFFSSDASLPEPSTLALMGAAALLWPLRRRLAGRRTR